MRKSLQLLGVFFCFLLFGFCIISGQKRNVQFAIDNSNVILKIKSGNDTEVIYPRSNEDGIMYFILPSFVKDNKIYCDNISDGSICIGNQVLQKGSCFTWEEDAVYQLACDNQVYEMSFVRSANVTTFFIDTESGTMDYLDADKNHEEQGYIRVISSEGNVEYTDSLPRISERGNSTFSAWKRSYTISLDKEYPLCGIEAGKKWNLLGMFYEHDKMHSKIIYDMGQYLNLEYSPDSTWVDLYCNGQYKGLFLLTEAITVGEGRVDIYDLEKENKKANVDIDFDALLPIREGNISYYDIENPVDISGGFLIEKEIVDELKPEEAYFTTNLCNYTFVVREPKHASKEQVLYIADFVQKIEDSFVNGTDEYKNYIDMDSFAKQFLIDKIVLEADEMQMSTFFYKEKGEDILKSGPIWDYDRSMGEIYPQYTTEIEDKPGAMNEWYLTLYEEEEFYQILRSNFAKLLPYMEELLNYKIDEYASILQESVYIDMNILKQYANDETRSYSEYDNYVRYLKYYLVNRLNYLIELWGIPHELFELEETNGEVHTVTFLDDNDTIFAEYQVLDGECIEEIPVLHDSEVFGWRFYNTDKFYNSYIPIYEDTILVERTRDNRNYLEYKSDMLKEEVELSGYLEMLEDEDFSYVKYEWEEDLLVVYDRGLQEMWEINLEKESGERSTTFGLLCYGTDSLGEEYIYIQDEEYNYLESTDGDIVIISINRREGSIVDVAMFEGKSRMSN